MHIDGTGLGLPIAKKLVRAFRPCRSSIALHASSIVHCQVFRHCLLAVCTTSMRALLDPSSGLRRLLRQSVRSFDGRMMCE